MAEARMIPWTWDRAIGTDVTPIMDLTREHFRSEATGIWQIDEQHFASTLTQDIVRQFFNPGSAFVAVARDNSVLDRDFPGILGYVWAERGIRTVWSSEEMVAIKIVHLDLSLPKLSRVRMISEMMDIWELWARSIGVDIICSSTMRGEQDAFLKMHQRRGYDCRGSICYRRLTNDVADQSTNDAHQQADHSDLR